MLDSAHTTTGARGERPAQQSARVTLADGPERDELQRSSYDLDLIPLTEAYLVEMAMRTRRVKPRPMVLTTFATS